MEEMQYS